SSTWTPASLRPPRLLRIPPSYRTHVRGARTSFRKFPHSGKGRRPGPAAAPPTAPDPTDRARPHRPRPTPAARRRTWPAPIAPETAEGVRYARTASCDVPRHTSRADTTRVPALDWWTSSARGTFPV